jgi:PAS domain S-box-containing protein
MLASLINNQRTENILEQTRQNFETFFNTIDDFLFIIDQEGNIIHTNNTVNNRLGFTKEELFDRSILSVHPPERREEAGRIVGEMLAGTAEYCPVPITTKSGQQIPVETRVKPGFWDGKPVIFGVTKDVSKIRLSEEKFSKAFQSNSSLMVISGFADKVFIDVNDMFLQTLGYSRDEIIGKTLSDFGFYADADVREALFEKLRMKIPVREIETRIFTKSGTIITGLFSADYLTIGNELCVLGVMVDITERKLAENEMIRQSGLITSLFDSIPDMIFFKDTKGYYLGCNPPFTEFVGKSRKDIIGKTDYDLFDKETADAFIYADRCTMAERNITLVEEWITYPDGHTVLVDTLKTPYSGSDGSLIGMLGISRDITDRKRNEEGIINQCRLVKQRHISA